MPGYASFLSLLSPRVGKKYFLKNTKDKNPFTYHGMTSHRHALKKETSLLPGILAFSDCVPTKVTHQLSPLEGRPEEGG